MISGSIFCGIGSTGGSAIIALKSILNAGNDCKCSITCGSAGGDGLMVGKRSQCDGSASDSNLTTGSASGSSLISESASCSSLTTGNADGVGCGCDGSGGGGCGD